MKVLITGSVQGIGKAIAEAFVKKVTRSSSIAVKILPKRSAFGVRSAQRKR